jgi:hypothetical protein
MPKRAYLMQIVGLVNGGSSEFDGQFLVSYDPDREGTSPSGLPMLAYITTTPDPDKAATFRTAGDAMLLWKRQSKRWPIRPYDGKPNRPLTAFTVEIAERESFRG